MTKVLIVEDSEELKEMYQIIFGIKKIKATTVSTKAEMMDQLISERPDIILMDVLLIGEDGREICKEIKSGEYKDIPVLLLSASPSKLEHYTDYLADGIIEKPFDINTLIGKVSKLLEYGGACLIYDL